MGSFFDLTCDCLVFCLVVSLYYWLSLGIQMQIQEPSHIATVIKTCFRVVIVKKGSKVFGSAFEQQQLVPVLDLFSVRLLEAAHRNIKEKCPLFSLKHQFFGKFFLGGRIEIYACPYMMILDSTFTFQKMPSQYFQLLIFPKCFI